MENSVSNRLDSLIKLQTIDSKLDEIKKIRGDLPEEVQDLEDEIAGYETRIQKFSNEISELDEAIKASKTGIKDSEKLIEKYEQQQMNVRNNREYDAITKEIELQDLEKQILDKKIKEFKEKIDVVKGRIGETEHTLNERLKDLATKKTELTQIISENESEEDKLLKDREKALKNLDDRLAKSYEKIRGNANNGLAVVSVKRNACGGCFNIVPPQRQADIKERKKLIVCEHCGRILADVEVVIEEEKPKRTTRKRKTTTKK
ncbi:zinc ribbon domain-containing protein [Chondrinema litorale]|uniref:zinc ribbon domain-containing protein n=1 Tax=Chondrinema litorale TaxID=2994555 RepID=UPI002542754B|nr:C4-type zinc ribbon domain-containing protein [Chondrinema litorale]UZR93870.1 C4-type zinc ribbon domain-containing protein [Chondrinema litorale]